MDEKHPAVNRLSNCVGQEEMTVICDCKGDDDLQVFRINEDKVIAWLKTKVSLFFTQLVLAQKYLFKLLFILYRKLYLAQVKECVKIISHSANFQNIAVSQKHANWQTLKKKMYNNLTVRLGWTNCYTFVSYCICMTVRLGWTD